VERKPILLENEPNCLGRGSVFGLNTLTESTFPEISLPRGITARVGALPWDEIAEELDAQGCAVIEKLLVPQECEALTSLYPGDGVFRSRVVMARHGFGRGEYKYFSYPLPRIVADLRTSIYFRLAPIANRWHHAMGIDVRFPARHADFIERCHAAGQTRPTPLLLQYGVDDYNCLHQDLYGEHVFPLQAALLLSEPGEQFTGGEFVMTEQTSNGQCAEVVSLHQGDAVVFAVSQRPATDNRGRIRKAVMRHGVSAIRSDSGGSSTRTGLPSV